MPLTGPAAIGDRGGVQPDGRHARRRRARTTRCGCGRLAAGTPTAQPGRHADRGHELGEHGRVQPGRPSLAAGTSDAGVLVWSRATASCTATLPRRSRSPRSTWDGPGRLASGRRGRHGVDVDAAVAPCSRRPATTTTVAYSPDGATLAVGGTSVQLWDATSRTHDRDAPARRRTYRQRDGVLPRRAHPRRRLQRRHRRAAQREHPGAGRRAVPGDRRRATRKRWRSAPTARVLATGADDGTVRLWSVTDPAHPGQLSSVHDSGTYVYTVVFAPDGKTLAAAEHRQPHPAVGRRQPGAPGPARQAAGRAQPATRSGWPSPRTASCSRSAARTRRSACGTSRTRRARSRSARR